jgi:hypothetical protein
MFKAQQFKNYKTHIFLSSPCPRPLLNTQHFYQHKSLHDLYILNSQNTPTSQNLSLSPQRVLTLCLEIIALPTSPAPTAALATFRPALAALATFRPALAALAIPADEMPFLAALATFARVSAAPAPPVGEMPALAALPSLAALATA